MRREEREDGAEERAQGEEGGECACGVVIIVAVVGWGEGVEDVAREDDGVFVHPVAGEDEGECGSGPCEGLGRHAGDGPCEPP